MAAVNMKAVLRLTGLNADRLRAWEKRYGAVRPARSPSGRRVYGEAEVNRLKLLADLVRQGHSIGGLAPLSDSELVGLLATGSSGATPARANLFTRDIEGLLSAINDFRLDDLTQGISRVRHLISPSDFAFKLVPQLLMQVGQKIESGEMSIAQEAKLSDLLRLDLRRIYEDLEPLASTSPLKRHMLFATPEGHYHDVGLILSAIVARLHGIKTTFVGTSLPAASLIDAARGFGCTDIALAIAGLPPEERKVDVNEYLKKLDEQLSTKISFWIGGRGMIEVKRQRIKREIWLFETIDELEEKLVSMGS